MGSIKYSCPGLAHTDIIPDPWLLLDPDSSWETLCVCVWGGTPFLTFFLSVG